jgi:hypothetical protein
MSKSEDSDFEAFSKELNVSPLDLDAIQMFELYKSLIKAGFIEIQALRLVSMIVNESMQDEIVFTGMDTDEEGSEEEEF